MRLAAEYQQRAKQPQQKEDQTRRYIVRLGRGLPLDQKRKRGISLSQENLQISQQSLGRNEVSREKERELVMNTQKKVMGSPMPAVKKGEEKVMASVATYGNRPQKINGYAAQHLMEGPSTQPQQVPSQQRYLSGVRSQETLQIHQGQRIQERLAPKLIPSQIIKGPMSYSRPMPQADSRPVSKDSRNFVEVNSKIAEYPSNIQVYQTRPAETRQMPLVRSNPIREQPPIPRMKSGQPIRINLINDARSKEKVIINSQRSSNAKEEMMQATRNTEKFIKEQGNPYSLSGLGSTRKNQKYESESQELKETKKMRGLAQCKQISSSSNVSINGQSKSNVLFSRTGLISLWDANKVESIVSLKESQEIKVQESEIMLDYFNPSDSMLRKL